MFSSAIQMCTSMKNLLFFFLKDFSASASFITVDKADFTIPTAINKAFSINHPFCPALRIPSRIGHSYATRKSQN